MAWPATLYLRLASSIALGVWLAVTLLPHIYQTQAFAALSLLTLAVAIAGGVRDRQRGRREQELEALVALRTRELDTEIAGHGHAAEALEVARTQARQALTAHALRGDRERCLEAGMDYYLPKPIRRRDLDTALGRAIPPDGRIL